MAEERLDPPTTAGAIHSTAAGNRYNRMEWAGAVNRRGGDVTVVHLPEPGIRGNTHFAFSDLNNLQIADLLSTFLESKGLAK
jgi:hypothetical protein